LVGEKTAILAFRSHRRGCNDDDDEEDDDTEEEGVRKWQNIKAKSGDSVYSDRQLFSPTCVGRRTPLLSFQFIFDL
jgi:hypothetical protein